ncbi:hypothetical protein EMIT0P201_50546 [Pseudomonas chlororaphis]
MILKKRNALGQKWGVEINRENLRQESNIGLALMLGFLGKKYMHLR